MPAPFLTGFIAAPFTSMLPDGSIDLTTTASYATFLRSKNISGAFILGTTGEGISLTIQERKAVAEEWMKYDSPDFKVIVHVGSASLKVCQELASHAQQIGASAVGVIGPSFFKPATVPDLVNYIGQVAGCCPDTPVYYYHIPSMSGVNLPMPEFLKQVKGRIPNLVGIKFTHHDLMEMNECLMMTDGQFEILHGFDETLLCGLALGINAAVGSTYNYFVPVYQKLWEAFDSGDMELARKMQQHSVKLVQVLKKYGGGIVCGKAIMKIIGVDCGPCRTPLSQLSPAELEQLYRDLVAIDFFSLSNTSPQLFDGIPIKNQG
ncbi:MAG TPA: dihydrodipicolinate synthase family protein [Saprospiraceae bacterium]|nr:dihydrodipicolinate synthase family protein [Saprospiraceae bacterium]HPR01320.1 dihydrodipicolinate synthase family protein [Saprospiraceae bacterium]HRV84522.1 dihydrodipicolinate synthase family protein [Saprospiraceae bacterium]